MIELDRRLRKLTFDDVVDWMDDRYAARAWNYRERVGDVFATEDGYWATVQGTEPYAVKLSADSSGGFVSGCSCRSASRGGFAPASRIALSMASRPRFPA